MEPSRSETSTDENKIENDISHSNTSDPSPTNRQVLSESTQPFHSDTEESRTEGRPSPPPQPPQQSPKSPPHNATESPIKSPSAETEESGSSHIRSKKRAIDTMLEGEEDNECISVEKQQAPPLPKRQTPPSGIKSKVSTPPSPPSNTTTFIDHPLYSKDDDCHQRVRILLEQYRQNDGLESGMSVFDFLDKWIKETTPDAIKYADALFELLLEDYNPATDERLVARICLVMSQILQRKLTLQITSLIVDAKRTSQIYSEYVFSPFD
jgi:hypothetical protein